MVTVGPRTLLLDIETSPNLVHAWGLFNQNIGLSQLVESSRMMCFSAKWLGDRKPTFYNDQRLVDLDAAGPEMVFAAHDLMNEADVIVHYNGNSFDIPILHSEFVRCNLTPPSPSKHVDLYRVIKKYFRFPSGKLAYVSKALGLEGKLKTSGHELWTRCLEGDPKAWAHMRRYNMRDVALLEDLYKRLLPWISNHPSVALFNGTDGCPNCGSDDLRREGFSYTLAGKYQRYQCRGCSAWSRAAKRTSTTALRGAS